MCYIKNISQFKGENTTVPERTLLYILLSRNSIRLFFKHANCANLSCTIRNNIAIFFTRISRLYAHEHEIIIFFLGKAYQFSKGLKILLIHIGIYRRYNYCLIFRNAQHIMQIRNRQSNCWKSISTTRFHGNINLVC